MSGKSLLLFDLKPSEVSDHPVRAVSTKSLRSSAGRRMATNSPAPQGSPVLSASEWGLRCAPPRPFSCICCQPRFLDIHNTSPVKSHGKKNHPGVLGLALRHAGAAASRPPPAACTASPRSPRQGCSGTDPA